MPRFSVAISDEAQADFVGIASYLEEHDPYYALQLARRLRAAADELGDAALRYALTPGHEGTGVRRRIVGRYAIYYRVRDETVEILHILHQAQDRETLLFPDD